MCYKWAMEKREDSYGVHYICFFTEEECKACVVEGPHLTCSSRATGEAAKRCITFFGGVLRIGTRLVEKKECRLLASGRAWSLKRPRHPRGPRQFEFSPGFKFKLIKGAGMKRPLALWALKGL